MATFGGTPCLYIHTYICMYVCICSYVRAYVYVYFKSHCREKLIRSHLNLKNVDMFWIFLILELILFLGNKALYKIILFYIFDLFFYVKSSFSQQLYQQLRESNIIYTRRNENALPGPGIWRIGSFKINFNLWQATLGIHAWYIAAHKKFQSTLVLWFITSTADSWGDIWSPDT